MHADENLKHIKKIKKIKMSEYKILIHLTLVLVAKQKGIVLAFL